MKRGRLSNLAITNNIRPKRRDIECNIIGEKGDCYLVIWDSAELREVSIHKNYINVTNNDYS